MCGSCRGTPAYLLMVDMNSGPTACTSCWSSNDRSATAEDRAQHLSREVVTRDALGG